MKKKIFVISDIHGDFITMVWDLCDAGYEVNNDNHFLIVCGDMFDRGSDSLSVYEYLKGLTDSNKAIVIRGNHETMFIDYLKGKSITPFNYIYNGTNETFADFLHQTAPFETWWALNGNEKYPSNIEFAEWLKEAVNEINTKYPELLSWLENLPYYSETKNYIFTHGAIDTNALDWRIADWERLTWDDGSFWRKEINNTDKTVVVGHYHTDGIREKYDLEIDESLPANQILYGKQKIYIDTCTVLTHRVNVLVIEDELL